MRMNMNMGVGDEDEHEHGVGDEDEHGDGDENENEDGGEDVRVDVNGMEWECQKRLILSISVYNFLDFYLHDAHDELR